MVMSDQTNLEEETAYHEAGHAVMGCLLQRFPLWVSIIPDGKGGVGRTEFDPDGRRYSHFDQSDAKKAYIRARVLIEVAGTLAHDIKFPGRVHDEGDAHDEHWARDLVIEVSWEDDRDAYLARAKQEAKTLLQENWNLVEKVAAALLAGKRLDRADLRKACGL
jgi:ATP-dependent Zn protease